LPHVARTQSAGSPHLARPPPPPPEAMIDEDPLPPQKRESQAMKVVRAAAPIIRRSMLRPALVIPAALAVGGAAGLVLYLRSGSAQVVVQQIPAAPAAVESTSAAPVFTPAAPAPEATSYRTANAGTTLVSVSSTPSGAEVRDADDRLLGMTPFDLRVPAASPLQLTLRHEGFKPVTLKKKVEGERVSLSVTMKKEGRTDPYEVVPHKRSVGYKDDPY
jgi:hypothetical protein